MLGSEVGLLPPGGGSCFSLCDGAGDRMGTWDRITVVAQVPLLSWGEETHENQRKQRKAIENQKKLIGSQQMKTKEAKKINIGPPPLHFRIDFLLKTI